MMAIKKKKDSERKRRRRKKKRVIGSFVLLEKIGDCEKAAAMKWWYTYRPILISDFKLESGGYVGEGKKKYASEDDVAGEKNQMLSNSFILSRL